MDGNRKGETEAETEADEGKSEMGRDRNKGDRDGREKLVPCKMTAAGLPIFI